VSTGSNLLSQGTVAKARRVVGAMRAEEWWDFKLVPSLMIFYASAVRLDTSLASLWMPLLTLLGALVPAAIYVSLVNDLTDLASDRAAGKHNRLAGGHELPALLGVAVCLVAGACFAVIWRDDAWLLGFYGSTWLAFTLYSVPPLRLKARGLAGVMADSAGANLFPALLAASVAPRGAGAPRDWLWLMCVACWAFAYGLRGILWHQLGDIVADKVANVGTFVQRRGPRAAAIVGKRLALPAELAAMALLIGQMKSIAGPVALALYLMWVYLRLNPFEIEVTFLEPVPHGIFFPQELYDLFLPLALLMGSSFRHPADLWVLAAQLLLFPRRPAQFVRELGGVYTILRSR
jgi:hypothetical protein